MPTISFSSPKSYIQKTPPKIHFSGFPELKNPTSKTAETEKKEPLLIPMLITLFLIIPGALRTNQVKDWVNYNKGDLYSVKVDRENNKTELSFPHSIYTNFQNHPIREFTLTDMDNASGKKALKNMKLVGSQQKGDEEFKLKINFDFDIDPKNLGAIAKNLTEASLTEASTSDRQNNSDVRSYLAKAFQKWSEGYITSHSADFLTPKNEIKIFEDIEKALKQIIKELGTQDAQVDISVMDIERSFTQMTQAQTKWEAGWTIVPFYSDVTHVSAQSKTGEPLSILITSNKSALNKVKQKSLREALTAFIKNNSASQLIKPFKNEFSPKAQELLKMIKQEDPSLEISQIKIRNEAIKGDKKEYFLFES